MNIIFDSDTDLASAWIELQRIPIETPGYNSLAAAAVSLNNLCLTDEDRAWKVVVTIFEMSEDEWIIENLGAGPVESLLDLHPVVMVEKIEHYVQERPDFRRVLKHVWMSGISTEHQEALNKLMR